MTREQIEAAAAFYEAPGNSKKERADLLCAADVYKELPPIKAVGKAWHVYENGIWNRTQRDIYRPKVQSIIPARDLSAAKEKAVMELLEGHYQTDGSLFKGATMVGPDQNILLNTLNGVLAVWPDKLELLPHGREYYFTRHLAANYVPDAVAPRWDEARHIILADPDDRKLLRYCYGNFLMPDARFETALVCYGASGTGKGTLAEPIVSIFEESNLMTRLSMKAICDSKSYSLPKLRYACVNLGTELESVEVEESSNFKTIVSGEPIEARSIYDPPFTMHTHCKLWFLSNHLPRFKSGSDAELRRTRFIHFTHVPKERDLMLKPALRLERDGVFLQMVKTLQELMTLKAIPQGSKHSQAVLSRFNASNDPIGCFVSTYCMVASNCSVPKESLARAYRGFCEEAGLSRKLRAHFFKMLYERYPGLRSARPRANGERIYSIEGIRLNEAGEQLFHATAPSLEDEDR